MTTIRRILSIDGGGIRGIVPAKVLESLEKKLQTQSNNPQARLADFFDCIAGTSTGGILTCIYLCPDENGKPKYSATDAVNLYIENGDKIFAMSAWQKVRSFWGYADEMYSAKGLETLLLQKVGSTRLSQLIKPCLITAYDIERRQAHFFSQTDAKSDDDYDFLVRDVCRATSAAPTYFEIAKLYSMTKVPYYLVDGGIFANNPSLCVYSEMCHLPQPSGNFTTEDLFMVSLGTDVRRSQGYDYHKARNWGTIKWIRPLIDMMMSGVNDTTDYHLKSIFNSAQAAHQYYRIDARRMVRHLKESEMDDVSPQNITHLVEFGTELASNVDTQLNEIADYLIHPEKLNQKKANY
jgi:uncharacterized protein